MNMVQDTTSNFYCSFEVDVIDSFLVLTDGQTVLEDDVRLIQHNGLYVSVIQNTPLSHGQTIPIAGTTITDQIFCFFLGEGITLDQIPSRATTTQFRGCPSMAKCLPEYCSQRNTHSKHGGRLNDVHIQSSIPSRCKDGGGELRQVLLQHRSILSAWPGHLFNSLIEALQQVPAPTFNFSQLKTSFARKGLSVEDLVVLSSGHTIGDMDPSLDASYAEQLKTKCKSLVDNTTTVVMDPGSGLTFDAD
eukprot:Gb_05424 [translate_table: standard]